MILLWWLMAAASLLGGGGGGRAAAATFAVTSENDTGPGTLRQALADVDALGGGAMHDVRALRARPGIPANTPTPRPRRGRSW